MKKIIQFIRTSKELENTIGNSIELAKALDMELQFFMVLETRNNYFYPMTSPLKSGIATYEFEKIREERQKEESERLDKFIKDKSKEKDVPHLSFEIRTGATDMILEELSKEEDTYMILINEAQEPEQGFLINVYLQVLEHTACPIMKLTESFRFSNMKKVLYATDYKEEDISTLKNLSGILAPFKSEVTALHVTDSIDLEEKLKSHGFEASLKEKVGYDKINVSIMEDKKVVDGILDYANKESFDMIVLLKENRNFLQRIFTRSDSNRVLSKADIPVMIFHQGEAS